MEQSESHSSLTLPMAIVVAGLIIAGAIFVTKNPDTKIADRVDEQSATAKTAGVLPAVVIGVDEHILGNPSAPIVIIEYSDTECPFCKNFHTTMQTLMSMYGKQGEFAWAYRHFPLDSLHSKARKESEALECAGEAGGNGIFWQYIDRLMKITPSNNQLDLAELPKIAVGVGLSENEFSACLASGRFAERVERDYADAVAHGGRGTPFNIIKMSTELRAETKNALTAKLTTLTGEAPSFTEDGTAFSVSGAIPLGDMTSLIEILKKN